jgi:PAS domain S-box-containing protein
MTNNSKKNMSTSSSKLRSLVEKRVREKTDELRLPLTLEESQRLVHELEVHQIELEMQNEELKQARTEIEKSLVKYTDLYEFAPVGYVSINSEGIVLGTNLTAVSFFGIDRSRLLGRQFGLCVASEDRLLLSAFIEKVFESKNKETCEVKLSKEGFPPCFVRLEAISCNSGQESRIAIIDVSGRKRAEEDFHNSRMRLSWVLKKICIGMWLNELPLGRLTWDEQTKKLFFINPEEEPTIELFWSRIHPDDREITRLAVENAIRDHTLYEIEHRAVDPDTGEIRWIHSAGQAIYAADATPTHFDGINFDISSRKQAEEGLQKAHDELELRVTERTLNLTKEIEVRKKTEETLQGAYAEIKQLKDRLQAENIYLEQEVAQKYNFGEIIGQSKILSRIFSQVDQVAPMNATVLLLGETGTGKGVLARAIHRSSARKGRPLITVNCTTLPATLIECELFGRERGAFTGSDARQIGRFELAEGGTIFLDEIGELPLELQSKLLRVIQDGEFERLGSPRTIKTDVRIIAATNRNLEDEIRNGKFREDLYYRLNVFPITMPPLRQRKEDITLLVNHFVDKFNKKFGKKIQTVSKDTLNVLQEYFWPGNVRELENVIERAVIISQRSSLQVLDHFDTSRKPEDTSGVEIKAMDDMEHDHIFQVLQKTGWRIEGKNGAAVLLGLNPSTLRARMKKHGIVRT